MLEMGVLVGNRHSQDIGEFKGCSMPVTSGMREAERWQEMQGWEGR